LGGQMRSQEFGEKSDVAKAKDAIEQFNLQQRAGVQQRNIGGLNEAQLRNLQEKQRISDSATNIRNQQQQYNKQLLQQQYENQMAKAKALSGEYGKESDAQHAAGQQSAQQISTIGQGIGQGISAAGDYFGKKKEPAGTKLTGPGGTAEP